MWTRVPQAWWSALPRHHTALQIPEAHKHRSVKAKGKSYITTVIYTPVQQNWTRWKSSESLTLAKQIYNVIWSVTEQQKCLQGKLLQKELCPESPHLDGHVRGPQPGAGRSLPNLSAPRQQSTTPGQNTEVWIAHISWTEWTCRSSMAQFKITALHFT